MGLVTPQQLETMLIMKKNHTYIPDALSTAEQVSEISGRGFGMSAVKENILKVGGRVKIENKPGLAVVSISSYRPQRQRKPLCEKKHK